jgi:VTT domain
MGSRVVASRFLRRMSGPVERAASTLNARGAAAVLVGRFTAVLRALMPALAGTARMPYRTFAVYNAVSGIVWAVRRRRRPEPEPPGNAPALAEKSALADEPTLAENTEGGPDP